MLIFLLYASSLLIATACITLICDYARGIHPLWSRKNIETPISSNLSLNDTAQELSSQSTPQAAGCSTALVEEQQERAELLNVADRDKMHSAHSR